MRPISPCYVPSGFRHHWSQRQDVFDEESCRYFLSEVGKRIVPCFPFSVGIEEVHSMIIKHYGLEQAADVLSILQELLEDDHNASGIGDDGDIWRSWRHCWRHRNDNAAYPFVPRVGNIVLGQPTPTSLRRLKASNFVQQQKLEHEFVATNIDAERACFDMLDPPLLEASGRSSSVKSEIDPRENKNVYKIPEPDIENDFDELQLPRGGLPVVSFSSWSQFPMPPSILDTPQGRLPVISDISPSIRDTAVEDEQIPAFRTWLSFDNQNTHTGSEHCLAGQSSGNVRLREHSTGRGVAQEMNQDSRYCATQQSTRSENRAARLIDGKIFMLKSARSRLSTSDLAGLPEATHTDPTVWRHNDHCLPVRSRIRHRKSWLRGLRQVVDKATNRLSTHRIRHQSLPSASVTNPRTIDMMLSPRKGEMNGCPAVRESNQRFGLDGSNDSVAKPNLSYIDLNKPLPVSPEGPRPKIHDSLNSRLSPKARETPQLPSTASTTSSKLSTKSSRTNFHGIARDLLQTESGSTPYLDPIQEINTSANPIYAKSIGGSSTSRPPTATSLDGSIQEQIFFHPPAMPPPPLDVKRPQVVGSNFSTKPMPHSQSAPMLHRQQLNTTKASGSGTGDFAKSDLPSIISSSHPGGFELRGRSPAKSKASNADGHDKDTGKRERGNRSHSPVKRLFGFAKKDSSNDSQEHSSPPPKTPCSNKKSSIKKWGEKIRYGFLTPDDEQLRTEDLIERHLNTDSPPTSNNSTFPVSLEPPTQAKLQSEIELYVTVTANRFLIKEAKAGRISGESVSKFKERWHKLGRPQVVEFHFDQIYQHELIYANMQTVKFHGDAAKDSTQVQSTLAGWRVMAREMSVRTFCSPDSVLRKHLHDAHRVLELLGAPLVTFLAYESMQIKSLQMISQRQKERTEAKRLNGHGRSFSDGTQVPADKYESEYTAESFQLDKVRLSPSPLPSTLRGPRKATGAEGAIMSLPLPPSRARLRPERVLDQYLLKRGLDTTIHEKPETLLL